MKVYKLLSLLTFILLMGCASTAQLTVLSDFDESVEFNDYQTFVICISDMFVDNSKYPNLDNNQVRQLIGNEVENQMNGLGYKTNVLKPQLQAGFQILVEEEESTFTNCDLQEDYNYWHACTINTVTYTTETLVVYVSDLEKNQVIWQASIPCELNKPLNTLKPYVSDLLDRLFDQYPKTN